MAVELWGGLSSEEMKKRIRELAAHGVSFEDIWIDAGWYGKCENCESAFNGDWSAKTGDWTPNLRVHPEGLRDVAEVANEAGMRLMLWLEPERARVGTKALTEHPDWFLSYPYSTADKILNYGNEQAWKYAYDTVRRYVKDLGLSCYRQDFNAELTSVFRAADGENRRGMTEIKHVMGMYRLWDALHEEFPELLIDNCSSGGRRIDIETLRRSIPFFRSDYQCNFNENPEVLQTHNANSCLYFPYIGCTSKTKSDTYAIRSSYASSWGGAFYNAIFQSMDESDFAWAKRITDEYRSIRRYFSCDFYNHGSSVFDDTSWAIFQYHDPASDSGIVMAFRRASSPFACVEVAPTGLTDGAYYRTVNLNDGSESTFSERLSITLPEKRSSVILRYEMER
jgi:alpha-galactosidase